MQINISKYISYITVYENPTYSQVLVELQIAYI